MIVFRKGNYHYKIITPAFVLVLIFVSVTASQPLEDHSNSKENDLLKVKLEVIEKRYCNNQIISFSVPNSKAKEKENYSSEKTGELRLKLKLSVTNTSTQPIILDKTPFQIARRIVAETNDGKRIGNTISNLVCDLI